MSIFNFLYKKNKTYDERTKNLNYDMSFYYGCFYKDDDNTLHQDYNAYSFFPYTSNESSDDFCFIIDSIIKDVLKNRKVLILVTLSYRNDIDVTGAMKCIQETYSQFICQNNNFLKCDNTVIIICDGEKIPITATFLEALNCSCIYTIYSLDGSYDITTFEQALSIINNYSYDICMDYAKYPDYLEFRIKENIDIKKIIEIIKNVCKEEGKKLHIKY